MNSLIIIAVVGILGGLVLCWIRRTAIVCDWGTSFSRSAVRNPRVAADGWLAAMTARNNQGTLGGSRCAAQSAHELLAKANGAQRGSIETWR